MTKNLDQIQLQTSREDVVELLGNPIQTTQENGMTVLWYVSKAPSMTDYVMLENSGVVFISTSYYTNPQPLSQYITQYGVPAVSYRKYPPETKDDSYNLVVHTWPSAGRSVLASGSDMQGSVLREDRFTPVTQEQYLVTWGKDLTGNESVNIASLSSQSSVVPVVTQTTSPYSGVPEWWLQGSLYGIIIISVVIVVLATVVIRKFTSRKTS